MKLLVEHAFSHEFAFDKKAFKTFDEVLIAENIQSSNVIECECELCHIPNEYCTHL